ncbi:uncharacterized protein LY89DRAFT_674742 [Mollisia scopiformis]|uniref:Uncharacterized protein n=1 Tax=Mollisia scopiformis TaxID=149040 RepID=A0A194WRH8_MOLSC|nr:uncharacterized protein LY89DRAFT_674742 [Mollisia scopiformis]KUJ10611.1 hypothetical protein LY89DRAFT_674742 [Mollisia scopiformis]
MAEEQVPTGALHTTAAIGKSGFEKDMMRPGIDKAYIVLGLEELGIVGRRRAVEEGGHCWFCNARGGCGECGAQEIKPEEEQSNRPHREETPSKKRNRELRPEKDRPSYKRVKAERSEGQPSTPNSMYSTPRAPMSNLGYSPSAPSTRALAYPDPTNSLNWNPHKYPDSPYGLDSKFGASSSLRGCPPQNYHSPLRQQANFNMPAPGPLHAGPTSQNWSALSYDAFSGQQLAGNMPYNAFTGQAPSGHMSYNTGAGLSREQPSGTMQAIIDPSLLHPNTKPETIPIPGPNSYTQEPINDNFPLLSGRLRGD